MAYIERIIPKTPDFDNLFAEHISRYMFADDFLGEHVKILDLGCGCGCGSYHLSQKNREVTAVDVPNLSHFRTTLSRGLWRLR